MNEHFTHIYAIWFIGNKDGDWQAMAGIENGKWTLHCRFRYYDGDQSKDAFECGDTKRRYTAQAPNDSLEHRNKMLGAFYKVMIPLMEARYESKIDEVLLDCANDNPKVIELLSTRSWAHIKTMSKEEYDAQKE